MKHEVLKEFKDKETGQLYLVGSHYESSEKKRIDELVKLGFLKGDKPKPKDGK